MHRSTVNEIKKKTTTIIIKLKQIKHTRAKKTRLHFASAWRSHSQRESPPLIVLVSSLAPSYLNIHLVRFFAFFAFHLDGNGLDVVAAAAGQNRRLRRNLAAAATILGGRDDQLTEHRSQFGPI